MVVICHLLNDRHLPILFFSRRLFFHAPSIEETIEENSLSVYIILWTTSYFNQEHFSLFILKILSEIFSVLQKEMKHFDIWRRMKRVWSLRPQRNDIKTGFYFQCLDSDHVKKTKIWIYDVCDFIMKWELVWSAYLSIKIILKLENIS